MKKRTLTTKESHQPAKSHKPAESHQPAVRREINIGQHHIYIGMGTLVLLVTALVLFASPRGRKVQAGQSPIIEIREPGLTTSPMTAELPELPQIAGAVSDNIPSVEVLAPSGVTISARDGIPVSFDPSASGLVKRPGVAMTKDLAKFAQDLSRYFSKNRMQALITSAVRTGDGQLEIIQRRIGEYGMDKQFRELANASVEDRNSWTPAWEWLKAHHVPVNPPADYVNDDGNKIGASLHLKGLAIDLVANDLDGLRNALVMYANTEKNSQGLHIDAVVREGRCVHLSLSR